MESTPPTNEKRNELFQKLKPCCVRISQLAIRAPEAAATSRQLQELTNQILEILNEQVQRNPIALDEKLAEYVFFPLYHIFRQMSLFPMILVENCVKCLGVLIVHGWRSKITASLVQQIFGLLTFIVDGVPGDQDKRDVPEETTLEAFRTLTALLRVAGQSGNAATGLTEPDSLPNLGHGITVMLEGVVQGANEAIQKEAMRTLQGVYTNLKDQAALANFLPGALSSLTKVLSTPAKYRKLVLVMCMETVSLILTRVLGDMHTRAILASANLVTSSEEVGNDKFLSHSWLKATTGQVKLALTRIMKLRTSDTAEVRTALEGLCLKLLDECHTTLAECASFLVETSMVLYDAETAPLSITNLVSMAQIYPVLAQEVKNTVYSWMSSLPRVMQGGDEDAKGRAISNLTKGIHLLRELRLESSTLEEAISSALRSSVSSLISSGTSAPNIYNTDIELLHGHSSLMLASSEGQYQPVLLSHESQKGVRVEMVKLLRSISSAGQSPKLAVNMVEHLRASEPSSQAIPFWLCFELIKAAYANDDQFADLMSIEGVGSSGEIDQIFNELYYFSVEVLDSHTESASADWQVELLALEVTAFAAKRAGQAFRPELIDVLFPIVSFLGSDNPNLRQHAIVTLNHLAQACEYGSVSELIVANVDYMVNSVALRLNTLDISPASTQVLTMMIRLAGPRLVPFLDDVVESIFAALENYHGYPMFVESLFTVLKELVDQAVRSDTLLLEGQKDRTPDHMKRLPKPSGYGQLLEFLDKRKDRQERDRIEAETGKLGQGHPQVPWKEDINNGEEEDEAPPPDPEKPPNSITYQLLLRITNLTQHYLTSPTPKLRRSLLELLSTATPALAADEDAFLPLVHAIWPVVIERLKDDETFIAVEACHALSGLCAAAGDFLASRFKTEWSDGLRDWCRKVKRQASSGSQARSYTKTSSSKSDLLIPTSTGEVITAKSAASGKSGSLGQHASPVRIWEGVVNLLTSLVTYVRLTDMMFDDILDLLGDVLEHKENVREALETINADAVWLVRYERGQIEWMSPPELEGVKFPEMKLAKAL